MRGKYFTGADADSCYTAAEEYFQVSRDDLHCRLTPAEEGEEVTLLALDPEVAGLGAVENMDAFFCLNYTDIGVILELFQHRGQGKTLSKDELALYLKRKSLTSLNNAALPLLLDKGWGFAQIAPTQPEKILDEEAAVTMDSAASKAFVAIWPAEKGGRTLDMSVLQNSLAGAGVVHGLDANALSQLMQEKTYFKNYLVAQATPAEHGKNGYLTFHFRRELDSRPKEDETGRVDYRNLDLFESVTEGQLLVTRTPPTAGVPGYNVIGKELPATPGKNVPLPKGKNISIDEESLNLYAARSGMVIFTENKVVVSNIYQVEGDADMSVGNIDFDGSVIIKGHIISGITVKASGNVDVSKVVEAATIIAGGNIMLRHGMQGMNKGRLEAGGSITASFIERATVVAKENITANIIAHSVTEAGDSLLLTGKNGSLVGGQAIASNVIKAQVIGSATETLTDIGVGMVPHKRSRMQFLQQELKRLPEDIEKLRTIQRYLAANPSDDPQKVAMSFSVNQSLAHNSQLLEEYNNEFEELSLESANSIHGKVHVSDTIFRGARVNIASANYRVMEDTSHCTFKISGGEIVFGSYEG